MNKWQKISSKLILDTPFFRVRQDKIVLPTNQEKDWLYWDSPDSAMVLGITNDKKLVMIKQYRYLVGREVMEFPSGSLYQDEKPEAGARREFEEETGYQCGDLVYLGAYYETYGQLNRRIHIFYSIVTQKSSQKLDSGKYGYEDIKVVLVDIKKAEEMAMNNAIDAMGSTLAVLLLLKKLK